MSHKNLERTYIFSLFNLWASIYFHLLNPSLINISIKKLINIGNIFSFYDQPLLFVRDRCDIFYIFVILINIILVSLDIYDVDLSIKFFFFGGNINKVFDR